MNENSKKDNNLYSTLCRNVRFLTFLPALSMLWPLATVVLLGATSFAAAPQEQPNILWITSEDNGISWVSCYGGTNAQTPAIDQLAEDGFRYTHCFDNAAVCAQRGRVGSLGCTRSPTGPNRCAAVT